MPKKLKVKKPKAPKAPRASRIAGSKKIGAKDKSVKQNVNVNVTSSGGGGSGGSSVPSSQPYYNPMVNAMKQGEREGENIQLKKLTDLLTKSIAPKAPAPEPIKTISFGTLPLFEGEDVNVDYQVKRKADLENKTLLERVNTNIVDDIEALVNNNDVNDEAQMTNNNNLVVESNEVSKSVGDNPEFEEDIVDAENFFTIAPKLIKQNKPKIDQVIEQTHSYYKEVGKLQPLLYDEYNDYHFKIIDGEVIPWSVNESRGALKEYTKKVVQSHYSANPTELSSINYDSIINYGKKPNLLQLGLLDEYNLEQQVIEEAKANIKKVKGKKGKKTNIDI